MLLYKGNQIFAGQLSPKIPPVVLDVLDIFLIAFLSTPKTFTELEECFLKRVPFISENSDVNAWLKNRVDFMLQANALVLAENHDSRKLNQSNLVDELIRCDDSFISDSLNSKIEENRFHLDRNFALLPCDNGYKLWSAKSHQYCFLTPLQVALLVTFVREKELQNVKAIFEKIYKPAELYKFLEFLVKHGLILPDYDQPKVLTGNDQKITNTLEVANSKTDSWQAVSADGRIPIYFVPHMENHFPLALGMLFTAIESFEGGRLLDAYLPVPITYMTPEDFLSGPYKKFGKGVWLFSNYMWSLDINLKISQLVKQHDTQNITIHGGPSTPNYENKSQEFFRDNESVDISIHNEGEVTICEVLANLNSETGGLIIKEDSLKTVAGISFRSVVDALTVVRTEKRDRLKEPDSIPSPYNSGVFDNYTGEVEAAIIESNRGCPFGCTFCDWGSATNQKVRKFELERVKNEIDWIAERKVRVLWIADANFGMYDRDIELAKHIVQTKIRVGFPVEVVVNYTKNSTWRLAEIIKIFNQGGIISQGVISIQTTDTQTLEVINRKNIKTSKYDELSEVFQKQNLPLSTDLMIGLPGATLTSFKIDLQRYFDKDVSVKAYPTQLLPNSPMADPDYISQYAIETDGEGYLISTSSYTNRELLEMKELYKFFTISDGYSVLRYLLRFLQWDYGIKALDFLTRLQQFLKKEPTKYPRLNFCFRFFDVDKCVPGGWRLFYSEVESYISDNYPNVDNKSLKCVISVSELQMPEESREYPKTIPLDFDFSDYFNNRMNGIERRLVDYSPAIFTVEDPDNASKIDLEAMQYDSHQFFWELHSSVSRAKSFVN